METKIINLGEFSRKKIIEQQKKEEEFIAREAEMDRASEKIPDDKFF